jgi:hypothetical protein
VVITTVTWEGIESRFNIGLISDLSATELYHSKASHNDSKTIATSNHLSHLPYAVMNDVLAPGKTNARKATVATNIKGRFYESNGFRSEHCSNV